MVGVAHTGLEGVESVATFLGQGALRFMLTYSPEKINSSYGQVLITVKDYRQIPALMVKVKKHLDEHFPHAEPRPNRSGPGGPVWIIPENSSISSLVNHSHKLSIL